MAVGSGISVGVSVEVGSGVSVGTGVAVGSTIVVGVSVGTGVWVMPMVGSVVAATGTDAVRVACTAFATRSGSGVGSEHPLMTILRNKIITSMRFIEFRFLFLAWVYSKVP